jgi:hypothetical protein
VLYAVELLFDPGADAQVSRVWRALRAAGVEAPEERIDVIRRPHISLAVFEADATAPLVAALEFPLHACLGMPLRLEAPGFFLTAEGVAFLAVVPSIRLLDAHRAVAQAIEPLVSDMRPHYAPDALLFHCTLATGVRDPSEVMKVLAASTLPIAAVVASAHLVEIPGSTSRFHVG